LAKTKLFGPQYIQIEGDSSCNRHGEIPIICNDKSIVFLKMKIHLFLICIALTLGKAYAANNCDFSKFKPIRLGSTEGKLYRKIAEPEYPPIAKENNIEGFVTVKVLFDGNGIVKKACAITGPSVLRKAAEDAAMKTLFEPLLLNGKKVPFTEYKMQFRFVLSTKEK
jgi:hypothetical protein